MDMGCDKINKVDLLKLYIILHLCYVLFAYEIYLLYNIMKNNKDLSQNASCYSYINICDPVIKTFYFIFQKKKT